MSVAGWYLPNYIDAWRAGDACGELAQIVVMNRPESMVEVESVDFDLILGAAEAEAPSMADVMAAISVGGSLDGLLPNESGASRSDGLIDSFLQRKDLRIKLPEEEGVKVEVEDGWELTTESESSSFEDDAASEELAAIYMSQGLYCEAKEIYNRLFLLYSEKSVYFATQIDKIEGLKENN